MSTVTHAPLAVILCTARLVVTKRHGTAHQRRDFARTRRIDPLRSRDNLQALLRGKQHALGATTFNLGLAYAGAQLICNAPLVHHGCDTQCLGCACTLLTKLSCVPIPPFKEAKENLVSVTEVQSAHAACRSCSAKHRATLNN